MNIISMRIKKENIKMPPPMSSIISSAVRAVRKHGVVGALRAAKQSNLRSDSRKINLSIVNVIFKGDAERTFKTTMARTLNDTFQLWKKTRREHFRLLTMAWQEYKLSTRGYKLRNFRVYRFL